MSNQYHTILVLIEECRIYLLKNVISVYVDVGECTDAIQHKDRGDFKVTGITRTIPFVKLSFLSFWLPAPTHP